MINQKAVLKLQYQGCYDEGLCYSPIDKSFQLTVGKITPISEVTSVAAAINSPSVMSSAAAGAFSSAANDKAKANLPVDEVSLAQSTLQSGSLFGIALSFLGFGLLLAVVYSLGMILVYISLGVMELIGAGLGAKRVGDVTSQADGSAKSHLAFERIASLAEL